MQLKRDNCEFNITGSNHNNEGKCKVQFSATILGYAASAALSSQTEPATA